MVYILDFDRTIFDTDRFIALLEARGLRERFPDVAIFDELPDAELRALVFPDARAFLAAHGGETVVLSSARGRSGLHAGSLPFLAEKIRRCGVAGMVERVVTVPGSKGAALSSLRGAYGEVVFIDDMLEHVAVARGLGIRAFRRVPPAARAGGAPEDPAVIADLTALPVLAGVQ